MISKIFNIRLLPESVDFESVIDPLASTARSSNQLGNTLIDIGQLSVVTSGKHKGMILDSRSDPVHRLEFSSVGEVVVSESKLEFQVGRMLSALLVQGYMVILNQVAADLAARIRQARHDGELSSNQVGIIETLVPKVEVWLYLGAVRAVFCNYPLPEAKKILSDPKLFLDMLQMEIML